MDDNGFWGLRYVVLVLGVFALYAGIHWLTGGFDVG